MVLTLLQRAAF